MSEQGRGSSARDAAVFIAAVAAVIATVVTVAAVVLPEGTKHVSDSVDFNGLRPPPPPSAFGTRHEIGTRGDDPNPRALFHGDYPSDADTQERRVGGLPARFSGYTTWVRSVTSVPATKYVDGYAGRYLRARVTVFNRDKATQHVCGCDFSVWTRAGGLREADVVTGQTVSPDGTMESGARRQGDVYLYVGTVRGPYYIVYEPDSHSVDYGNARGVWRARV
jgi:hypothetical protein